MKDINELKQERYALIQKQGAILQMEYDENRRLTPAEEKEYKELTEQIKQLDEEVLQAEASLERRRQHAAQEAKLLKGRVDDIEEKIETVTASKGVRSIKGFVQRDDQLSEADFFKCLVQKDYKPLQDYRVENRAGAKVGIGVAGGFAVPEVTRLAVLDGLLADQGIFARTGKEFVEGADSLNVATYENCNIDDHGLYGFSTPEFIAEGGSISAGTPRLVKRDWKLKKLVAETKISIEMAALGTLGTSLQDALKNVLKFGLERYIVGGAGAAQPVGLIDAPCSVSRTRTTASQIAFADVYNMVSTTRLTTGNCWIGSQTIIPQLAAMVDAGSHAVWMPGVGGGAAQPVPPNLMGYPILFNIGCSPALGSEGDLIFCSDLSFYKVVMFHDIIIQTSEAAHWSTGELGLRVIMLLDMGALPSIPITVGGSTYGWHTVLSA